MDGAHVPRQERRTDGPRALRGMALDLLAEAECRTGQIEQGAGHQADHQARPPDSAPSARRNDRGAIQLPLRLEESPSRSAPHH